MGAAFANWLADNRDVYIGNATAVRDFRIQLRGNRSVLLFGIYLFVLIGVAVVIYSASTGMVGGTIVDAQAHLKSFYQVTMGLLGLTVCVVAPGLTATTIVMERQRQSIDLVFSAPVTPKYYLVGKMISSFRYTWMLLVLALPVTAASVVLGGASWSDVLVSYILLSLQGLMLTSFALLMSTVSPKPVGAIIWSYTGAILYNGAAFAGAQAALGILRFGHGAGSEAPFFVVLSPWTVSEAARTYTVIGGHHVANWLIMFVVSLLIAKICLLGAGSILSPSGGKEVVGLRLHGLLYTLVISGLVGWALGPGVLHVGTTRFASIDLSSSGLYGILASWLSAPLFTFLPFIACYGFDRELRYRPNGTCKPLKVLDGTPGGGLPFLLAIMGCLYGGYVFGGWNAVGNVPGYQFWEFAFYTTSFWVMFWSMGRALSAFCSGLKTVRTLLLSAFIFIVVLPFPFIVAVAGVESETSQFNLWDLYVISPLIGHRSDSGVRTMTLGFLMLGLSLLMVGIGDAKTKQKLSGVRNYDEQPYQAA